MNHVQYDYIITVLLNASVRDLQRYVDASNHSLLDELLDDLGETSRKIFVFCNVPQQEGPFVISRALGNDSYYLIDAQKPKARKRDDSGKESERPWNANLLRRFYS